MQLFSFNNYRLYLCNQSKVSSFCCVTECIVYMFRAIPFNLFFPVLFLFDWVGFLWPNYLRC